MPASASQSAKLLICYSGASTFTNTTREYLLSFSEYSSFEVYYLHVSHGAIPAIELDLFDAVALSYCARLCIAGYVSPAFLEKLERYNGVKAVFIQDEYDNVNLEINALRRFQPNIIFTCVPADQVKQVYPPDYFPNTKFIQVLTGYVPKSIPRLVSRPIKERPIDIGYRGRSIGLRYGKLGLMKSSIGQIFRDACKEYDFVTDIHMDERSRIYGSGWFDWLQSCRVVLGSESGSNIFDFDGSIANEFKNAEQNGKKVSHTTIQTINELDNKFNMGQISPRVFEATSMGCALVMYRGNYSSILRANDHYLPVEHDGSNIHEVLAAIKDNDALEEMISRCRRDLLDSNTFSYQSFVSLVESHISSCIAHPPKQVLIPIASEYLNTAGDALNELPTRLPMHFDSFQLRSVLTLLRSKQSIRSVPRMLLICRPEIRKIMPNWVKHKLRIIKSAYKYLVFNNS